MSSFDPVCGTELAPGTAGATLTHRGIAYHFCSPQCLERFQATPALFAGGKRHTEIPSMPKQRRLRIATGDAAALSRATHRIAAMKGVKAVTLAAHNGTVAYDLRLLTLAQIEKALTECGVTLREGLHGWRRALWRFAESNECENAARAGTGACCSRPPPRLR